MANEAQTAIETSIHRSGEIITIPYTQDAYEDLLVSCDDNVEANDAEEFWGTDAGGNAWRVHLDLAGKAVV